MENHELELRYWPEMNQKGYSAWRLACKDNRPMKFPRTFDLMRIFRRIVPNDSEGIRVLKRGETFCMILMRTGISAHYRKSFLMQISR